MSTQANFKNIDEVVAIATKTPSIIKIPSAWKSTFELFNETSGTLTITLKGQRMPLMVHYDPEISKTKMSVHMLDVTESTGKYENIYRSVQEFIEFLYKLSNSTTNTRSAIKKIIKKVDASPNNQITYAELKEIMKTTSIHHYIKVNHKIQHGGEDQPFVFRTTATNNNGLGAFYAGPFLQPVYNADEIDSEVNQCYVIHPDILNHGFDIKIFLTNVEESESKASVSKGKKRNAEDGENESKHHKKSKHTKATLDIPSDLLDIF